MVKLGRIAGAHDAVVPVKTYFEANQTAYMVMEYIEGESLETVLRQQPDGLAAATVETLVSDLLRGLRMVHGAGMMHRDVKPANIIMRPDGRPVLIDFGSTRELSAVASDYTQIFSARYAPVEQILGQEQGPYSDIYAVGAVGYRAIGGTLTDALVRHAALASGRPDPMPSASHAGAGRYRPALLAALDAALSVDARNRPRAADALLSALEAGAEVENTVILSPALPLNRATSAVPPVQRSPWGLLAAGATALATAGVLAALLLHGGAPVPGALGPPRVVRETSPESSAELLLQRPASAAPHDDPQAGLEPQSASSKPAGGGQPEAPAPPAMAEPSIGPDAGTPAPSPDPTQRRENDLAREMLAPAQPLVPQASPPTASEPKREDAVADLPLPPQFVSPIEAARTLAATPPCSVLVVLPDRKGLRVSGQALPGRELDAVLPRLTELGVVVRDVAPLGSAFCPVAKVLADLIRANRVEAGGLALQPAQRSVASGGRLGLRVEGAGNGPLLMDAFFEDGTVRHLLNRPARASNDRSPSTSERTEWVAAAAPGTGLLLALVGSLPPGLAGRPDTEDAASYLAVLEQALASAADQSHARLAADLALVEIRPADAAIIPSAEPRSPPRPTPSRPRTASSGRCEAINERTQLGDPLSDADRKILASGCN